MTAKYEPLVQEIATNKPTSVQDFTFADAALAGMRNFSVYTAGDNVPYFARNGGSGWESGYGTYSAGVLARTVILRSSNADAAVDFSAGPAVTVHVEFSAADVSKAKLADSTLRPGGRLTLESLVPVSSSDQLAKTTLYYTPYTHDVIQLWDGVTWAENKFTELNVPVGTLANVFPHDVFCYLNAGVPTLELDAWTSDSVRASAVSIIDGRYCKTADKTRLLIGTVLPKTATTIEDSLFFRGICNIYNLTSRKLEMLAGSSAHTYTADASVREYNGTSGVNIATFISSFSSGIVTAIVRGVINSSGGSGLLLAINQSTSSSPAQGRVQTLSYSSSDADMNAAGYLAPASGRNVIYLCDRNTGTADLTADWGEIKATVLL